MPPPEDRIFYTDLGIALTALTLGPLLIVESSYFYTGVGLTAAGAIGAFNVRRAPESGVKNSSKTVSIDSVTQLVRFRVSLALLACTGDVRSDVGIE
jgi:hypothetical protein